MYRAKGEIVLKQYDSPNTAMSLIRHRRTSDNWARCQSAVQLRIAVKHLPHHRQVRQKKPRNCPLCLMFAKKKKERDAKVRPPELSISAQLRPQNGTSLAR